MLHVDPSFPVTVGSNVTIGHRAIVHGATVHDNVIIGMGATVLNGAVIGENSIVGANALVTEGKHFPPGSLILGSPAKVVRTLTEEEIARIQQGAETYVAGSSVPRCKHRLSRREIHRSLLHFLTDTFFKPGAISRHCVLW
ncbi:MAG: gamma carbonic anhydrase family protein [Caldilineaceae bacterium]